MQPTTVPHSGAFGLNHVAQSHVSFKIDREIQSNSTARLPEMLAVGRGQPLRRLPAVAPLCAAIHIRKSPKPKIFTNAFECNIHEIKLVAFRIQRCSDDCLGSLVIGLTVSEC
jgi:hypothetical protein